MAATAFEQLLVVPVTVKVESPREAGPVCTVMVTLLPKATDAGNPGVVASAGSPEMASETLAGTPMAVDPAARADALTVYVVELLRSTVWSGGAMDKV